MYRIAICDPIRKDRRKLSERIREYDTFAKITEFSLPGTFLEELESSGCNYDIVFIEIDFGDQDGIQIASTIHNYNAETQIIYNTRNTAEISRACTSYFTFYLLKDQWDAYLTAALNKSYAHLKQFGNDLLHISFSGVNSVIRQRDILYMERSKRVTFIFTENNTYKTSENFSELSERLTDRFVICHRSYIVNLLHVSRFTRTYYLIDDGTVVPVGRSRYPESKQAFKEYVSQL